MAPQVSPTPTSARGPYDGIYDEELHSYILPPLIGLPFEDMRANGQGARHYGDTRYKTLIIAHALFAGLAFMVLIPSAIILMRYYRYYFSRIIQTLHTALNVLAVLCVTVAFVCAYFAVGIKNSWTNPHHIIGLSLFVGILLNAAWGSLIWVAGRRRKKDRSRTPFMHMLHMYIGRGLMLLGFAQVPLGLVLYGSPLYLFILYAAFMFILLIFWFFSSWAYTQQRWRFADPDYLTGGYGYRRRRLSHLHHATTNGTTHEIEETVEVVNSPSKFHSPGKRRTRIGPGMAAAAGAALGFVTGRRHRRWGSLRKTSAGRHSDSGLGSYHETEEVTHHSSRPPVLMSGGAVAPVSTVVDHTSSQHGSTHHVPVPVPVPFGRPQGSSHHSSSIHIVNDTDPAPPLPIGMPDPNIRPPVRQDTFASDYSSVAAEPPPRLPLSHETVSSHSIGGTRLHTTDHLSPAAAAATGAALGAALSRPTQHSQHSHSSFSVSSADLSTSPLASVKVDIGTNPTTGRRTFSVRRDPEAEARARASRDRLRERQAVAAAITSAETRRGYRRPSGDPSTLPADLRAGVSTPVSAAVGGYSPNRKGTAGTSPVHTPVDGATIEGPPLVVPLPPPKVPVPQPPPTIAGPSSAAAAQPTRAESEERRRQGEVRERIEQDVMDDETARRRQRRLSKRKTSGGYEFT